MAKVSLERLSKTFIETAKSHGISVSQAKEAFEEAKRDMDRRKDEKGYQVKDSLMMAAQRLANGLVECQMTCIWY